MNISLKKIKYKFIKTMKYFQKDNRLKCNCKVILLKDHLNAQ